MAMHEDRRASARAAVLGGLILFAAALPARAQWRGEDDFRAGRLGLGFDASMLNFGFGPIARYWVTENLGAQAGFIAAGDFKGYSVRGMWQFDLPVPYRPYAGVGYMSMKATEDAASSLGILVEQKGSGPALFAGVEGNLFGWNPNLYWAAEVMYLAFELETTASDSLGTFSDTQNLSSFGTGISLVYYFNLPRIGGWRGRGASRSTSSHKENRESKPRRREDSGGSRPRWSPRTGGGASW